MKAKKNYKGGGMLGKILNPGQMLPGKLGQFFSKLPGGAAFGGDNRKNPSVTPNIPVPKLQEGGKINDDPKAKRKKKRKLRKLKRKIKKVSRGAVAGAGAMAGKAAAKGVKGLGVKRMKNGGKVKKKKYNYSKTELTEQEKKAVKASKFERKNTPGLKKVRKSAFAKMDKQEAEKNEQTYRAQLKKGQRKRYDKSMASGKEGKITRKIDKRTRFYTGPKADKAGIYDYSMVRGSKLFTEKGKKAAVDLGEKDKASRITKPKRKKR